MSIRGPLVQKAGGLVADVAVRPGSTLEDLTRCETPPAEANPVSEPEPVRQMPTQMTVFVEEAEDNNEEATDECFGQRLAGSELEWYRSGDLGFLLAGLRDRRVCHCGNMEPPRSSLVAPALCGGCYAAGTRDKVGGGSGDTGWAILG